MKEKPRLESSREEDALFRLLRAIGERKTGEARRMLTKLPLATLAVTAGATRANQTDYFLKKVGHYIFAGDTALHMAAAAYDRELAQELVSKGADLRAKNRRGAEPLHYAADGGPGSASWNPAAQKAVIEFLIGAGADPNCTDKTGVMPLHRAVRTRCSGAVLALLGNGADVRARNGNGSTPLHLAVQNTGRGGSGDVVAREEQAEIIRILLKHGAKRSDKNSASKRVDATVRS
ncbi:MAG TPA: ankyrin repeat domain-containing protein, partial [Candidatus Dormibacteraeota bacterium]|nr:ankyrin repeat domain-containing protein [Candidatus Dormibacteraeota bacterium]